MPFRPRKDSGDKNEQEKWKKSRASTPETRKKNKDLQDFGLKCNMCGSDKITSTGTTVEKGYSYTSYRCNVCSNEFIEQA